MNTHLNHPATVGTQYLRALARFPERIAFKEAGLTLTYRAAADLVARIQKVLLPLGRPGVRVAFLTANRAEPFLATVAALLSRFAITWLHPLNALAEHLDQLADSEAEILVVDMAHFRQRGGEISAAAPQLQVLTWGAADYGIDLQAAAYSAGSATAVDLARADDLAALNYTGGTTGRGKGVMRRHHQYSAFTEGILTDFEIPNRPRTLLIAPMSHVGGLKLYPTLARGGTVHMAVSFDPAAMLSVIARERISMTMLVPTMIYRLLDCPELAGADVSSLETLLYGAAPMSTDRLIQGIERFGPIFAQLYGQTEAYPIAYLSREDHDPTHPESLLSCGFPTAMTDVRILGHNHEEAPVGEPGEICARGRHAMEGYWKRPDETAATIQDGWIHTGDIACRDERGYLHILDRKKDLIISGGFNIYSREVEDVLASHPGVAVCAVVGAPDATWGEAVTAVVVAREGHAPTAEELIQLVRMRKGVTFAPKQVEFVSQLPLTSVGKIDKKAIRARYWQGHERQVG